MIFWLVLGVTGLFAVVYAARVQRHRRVIRRTPTVRSDEVAARATANGGARCEVTGVTEAGPDGPLTAPLSGISCVWYRVQVLRREPRGFLRLNPGFPQVTLDARSARQFVVRDAAGTVPVQPKGADVLAGPRVFSEKARAPWIPSELAAHPLAAWAGRITAAGHELEPETGVVYHVREWVLPAGQPVYVLGSAGYEHPAGRAVVRTPAHGEPYWIGLGSERDVLRRLTRGMLLGYGAGALLAVVGFGIAAFGLWAVLTVQ